jgi:hypothetical protein
MRRIVQIYLAMAVSALAQTTINGGRVVSGTWDASNALSSKPAKTGSSLPSACGVGEQFFLTTAPAGNNLYLCAAANTWSPASAPQAGNFPRASVNGSSLNFFGACTTPGSPCVVPKGGGLFDLVSATNSIAAPSGSGTVFVYWSASGPVIGTPNGISIIGTGGGPLAISSTQGVTNFYTAGLPAPTALIAKCDYAGGAWTASSLNNYQPAASPASPVLNGGLGVLVSNDGQTQTASVDQSVVITQNQTTPATINAPLRLNYFTTLSNLIASYPCTTANRGMIAGVTDATATEAQTWGSAVTAGSDRFASLVFCDGSGTWRSMGL